MSERCQRYEKKLVALYRGELSPLEREGVRAHLQGCAACEMSFNALAHGFDAARGWDIEVPPGELERLSEGLTPYIRAAEAQVRATPRRRVLALGGMGFGAVLAGALGVMVVLVSLVLREGSGSDVETSSGSGVAAVAPPPGATLAPGAQEPGKRRGEVTVERRRIGPHLRLVASSTWDGRVEGPHHDVSIAMSNGFAVFSFRGGEGRRLRVTAPDALVEVVGTRFYVETSQEVRTGQRLTRVGVAEGVVRVLTLSGTKLLRAGESLLVGAQNAPESAAAGFLDDASLTGELSEARAGYPRAKPHPERVELGDEAKEPKAPRASPGAAAHVSRGDEGFDTLNALERAEAYTRAGAFRDAIDIYRVIAAQASSPALRDLSRYEMARLWGLKLGDVHRARGILLPLAQKSEGEVQRQARLALCELDLGARPCRAKACLVRLQGYTEDFPLTQEAARLFTHWRLEALDCTAPSAPGGARASQAAGPKSERSKVEGGRRLQ